MSSFSTNINLESPDNGADVNTWNVPVNANWTAIDTAIGGFVQINSVGASGVVALTLAQYRCRTIRFNGAITANINYQLPSGVGGHWVIVNATTGAFSITVSSAGGGSSLVCPQGASTFIYCDGSNVRTINSIISAPGANTQVVFNSGGSFAASANLTFNGTTLSGAFSGSLSGNVATTATVGSGGPLIGYRNIPASANTAPAAADVGKYLPIASGTTINAGIFAAGDIFSIYNSGSSPITLTQGSGVTLRLAGTTTTGSRTLAILSFATFFCIGGNTLLVSGPGLT